jgi:hypothetical protein
MMKWRWGEGVERDANPVHLRECWTFLIRIFLHQLRKQLSRNLPSHRFLSSVHFCENDFYKKTATINFNSSVTHEWFWRLSNTLNDFVHWWQVKGFSPLCTLVQILRMSILLNDFVHRRHLKGFSPVCTLKWFWRMCALVWFWRLANTPNYFVHWRKL